MTTPVETPEPQNQGPPLYTRVAGSIKYVDLPYLCSWYWYFAQRKHTSDEYIELAESGTGTTQPQESLHGEDDHDRERAPSQERASTQGIMRTIEIDRSEDYIRRPPHALTSDRQANVKTEVTGGRTRMYDDESDGN